MMQSLSESLKQKKFEPKPHALKHEWQAFAYKIWKDYSNNKKDLPRVIQLVKRYNENYRGYLDSAYNFCKDYQGPVPKIKLFYWKFWQLKKQNEREGKPDTGRTEGMRQTGASGQECSKPTESSEKPDGKNPIK